MVITNKVNEILDLLNIKDEFLSERVKSWLKACYNMGYMQGVYDLKLDLFKAQNTICDNLIKINERGDNENN